MIGEGILQNNWGLSFQYTEVTFSSAIFGGHKMNYDFYKWINLLPCYLIESTKYNLTWINNNSNLCFCLVH